MIDTHCHLSHPDFNADRESVINRCWEHGVRGILEVGYSADTSRQALELTRRHPHRLRASAGIHPHEAGAATEADWEVITALTREPEVIAFGETGLDFYRDWAPRDKQDQWFRRSVRFAAEHDLPLIVHDRDAHDDVLGILRQEGQGKTRGVFHCFSGDQRVAEEAMALGFYLGLGGSITYWSMRKKGRLLKQLPLDRILLETDAPWLAPKPRQGERNDPTLMTYVVDRLAEAHDIEPQAVITAARDNTERLLGPAWWPRD